MKWSGVLGDYLRLSAGATDELIDAARAKLAAKLATNRPRCVCAYRGYATRERAYISGRVLANRTPDDLGDSDRLWRNLLNTYRRFETDEIPDASVTIRVDEYEQTAQTDDEGFYHVEIPRSAAPKGLWLAAEARCQVNGEAVTGTHAIVAPGPDAEFGVISDLDDTVIETNVTSVLTAAKLTFIGNAKTRKPLEGVAALYDSFVHGKADRPINPIFYVSSSPWNLYDLLSDFMELNEIPPGPIFLRDYGIDRTKFIQAGGHREKLERTLEILRRFPDLPFVLVGDSGQQDAGLYAEAATLHPHRIRAIYIRDVDPQTASQRDDHVREHIETAGRHGVPMLLVPDSGLIAHHAMELGLITRQEEKQVQRDVAKDHVRPDPGATAVKEALGVEPSG